MSILAPRRVDATKFPLGRNESFLVGSTASPISSCLRFPCSLCRGLAPWTAASRCLRPRCRWQFPCRGLVHRQRGTAPATASSSWRRSASRGTGASGTTRMVPDSKKRVGDRPAVGERRAQVQVQGQPPVLPCCSAISIGCRGRRQKLMRSGSAGIESGCRRWCSAPSRSMNRGLGLV